MSYSTNSDLVLDTGESLSDYLKANLSSSNKTTTLNNARTRAYNYINNRLKDVTVIPSSVVNIPDLFQIEIDLVIANILSGAITAGTKRREPSKDQFYYNRAMDTLHNLTYPATSTTPAAGSSNTGNGSITAITVNDYTTITEKFTLICIGSGWFKVQGTRNKKLPDCQVGVSYPDITQYSLVSEDYGFLHSRYTEDYGDFPISFKITDGATSFVTYDTFTFQTYASSRRPRLHNKMVIS